MVAQDQVTAWDLKPNRENTNQIFNVLCNVQPVEHPWSGDWYARDIDVKDGSKQQYRFEKCKGLKRCKLYQYECHNDGVKLIPERTGIEPEEGSERTYIRDVWWKNSNFTDVITFWGYRIYMRKKNLVLNPYGTTARYANGQSYVDNWGDWNINTCDVWNKPSDVRRGKKYIDPYVTTDINSDTYNLSDKIRIYIQPVDTKGCTWDTFDDADEAPIILVREFEAAECNPDHFIMGYWGIGTPEIVKGAKLATISYWGNVFAYIYDVDKELWNSSYIFLQELGVYIWGLTRVNDTNRNIISFLELPDNGYFIPNTAELLHVIDFPIDLPEGIEWDKKITTLNDIYIYKDYGEIPYFATQWKIYSINGFFSRKDHSCVIPTDEELNDVIYTWGTEDRTGCRAVDPQMLERRVFLYTTEITTWAASDVITGLEAWNSRLVYIANNQMVVSGSGTMNWIFSNDITSTNNDAMRWVHSIPAGITDLRIMYNSILLFGPKKIYAVVQDSTTWLMVGFITASDNEDGYYSPTSLYNDDGEFLIVRRWKLLENLEYSSYYGTIGFKPDVGFFVNWHIKSLNPDFDMVSIDATVNHRYISIYDNNDVWPHYSKLLIYDKHYNCWYHWLITWARVVHVKDNIFLWDWVYVNKWRTWWWETDDTKGWEIIEIISAYVGEEWLQTPKHIQFVKTAVWDHSVITSNSLWDIDLSYGNKLFRRRNDITATRYPQLLPYKNRKDVIATYEIGEQIYWHWELLSHNLLNEISEYRNYDKFSTKILRELWEDSDMESVLARYASIKEPINAPANVIELSISARHLDNVEFGSFYIGYYQLDADYEDIENVNIDISDATDNAVAKTFDVNKWEVCDEILDGSACDSPDTGNSFNS